MKPSFKQLVEILSTTEGIHIRSERFVAVPVDHCERSTLESALKAAGYSEAAQVNSDAHVFSLSAGAWNELPPIYKDEESFWEANGTAGFVPEHFYIISSGASSLDEDVPFIKSVFLIFKTRSLINKVADHYISSDQKALFFVSDEGKGVKKDVVLSLSIDDVLKVKFDRDSLASVDELFNIVKSDDVHKSEREEVFRRALTILLEEPHNDCSDLLWVINNISRLHRKYKEQYEIYFHNFSVSKLLNEIDQKSLEFTSKLMEFISSSQNKALSIPGAIIAIAALVRLGGGYEVLLVVLGLWLVKKIVIMSNDAMSSTFNDLKWQVEKSFEKYKKIKDSDEVVELAVNNKDRLIAKIEKADLDLKKINKLANATFVAGCIYAAIALFSGGDKVENQAEVSGSLPAQSEQK
ncbi:MAG TPA: hypothetical protein DCX44_03520 [Halomonas sp.]|nr:hypothetical protein [uncultured Halomonas sp.]HAV44361.1 hypothetical protein [Halomonas sp.]|tara:strand:- start:122 stop:1348 length:1227 start_codon:yes stop_codon:yes gene_type:complete